VTLLLCILWFIGGFACGGICGYRATAHLCARAIQTGSMRRIIEEFEEKYPRGEG
jgi:hypothetical protein